MTKSQWARVTLLLTLIFAGMDLGGSLYEGALIFPVWSAHPPQTFSLIQPQNGGISLVRFWVPVHGLMTLGFLATLILSWSEKAKRKLIGIALLVYLAMRAWTFAYFIPEITAFIAMAPTAPASAELTARTARWGLLSHGRGVLVLISTVLLMVAAMKEKKK